ncbi:MAG: helix-turn-helix domain-containing protein [Anaerolineales bacterium]|nr:helix-turn-helix domain-containing protein [Anaerolineales bacterium]
MGMGAGMAGMIMSAMQPGQQAAAQPAAAAAPAAAPGVMTLEEAAAYLKVAPSDVQAAIDAGELKAKKIGSQYRIAKDAIDTYLAG